MDDACEQRLSVSPEAVLAAVRNVLPVYVRTPRLREDGLVKAEVKVPLGPWLPIVFYVADGTNRLVVRSDWGGRLAAEDFANLQADLPEGDLGGLRRKLNGRLSYSTACTLFRGIVLQEVVDTLVQSHQQALRRGYARFCDLKIDPGRPEQKKVSRAPARRSQKRPKRRRWWRPPCRPFR